MDVEAFDRQPEPWANEPDDTRNDNSGTRLSRSKSSAGGYGERNGNAVDYDQAVADYEDMRRELTRQSTRPTTMGRPESGSDVEKSAEERFDLTDFLSGIDRRLGEQGFQPKHLGLVVRNLTVKVLLSLFMSTFLLSNKDLYYRDLVLMQNGSLLWRL